MSLLSRSFGISKRLSFVPVTRCFSSVTHSFSAERTKPLPSGMVEPTLSASSVADEEWAHTNSDADTPATQQQQQQRNLNSMSMSAIDEQAKERVENMEKEDWTFEAEAMSQDIHASRGQKSSPDTDYV